MIKLVEYFIVEINHFRTGALTSFNLDVCGTAFRLCDCVKENVYNANKRSFVN